MVADIMIAHSSHRGRMLSRDGGQRKSCAEHGTPRTRNNGTPEHLRRHATGQSLSNFCRLTGVAVDLFADDPQRDLVEIMHERLVQLLELRPRTSSPKTLPGHTGPKGRMLTQRTEDRNWKRNPPSGGQYCERIHTHAAGPPPAMHCRTRTCGVAESLWLQKAVPGRAAIGRFKRVIGDGLRSRTDRRRATEVDVANHALNRMLEFGRPIPVRIA